MVRFITLLVVLSTVFPTTIWAQTPAIAAESTSRTAPLPTQRTARTLAQNEWLVGLWRTQYGLLESLDVGTYQLYLALGMPNAFIRHAFWENDKHAVSLNVDAFYLDSDFLWLYGDEASAFWALLIPIEFRTTIAASDQLFLTFGVDVTLARGEGQVDGDTTQGLAAAQQLILPLTVEWEFSQRYLVGLHMKYSPFAELVGEGDTTVQIDPTTRADIQAAGAVDPQAYDHAFSAIAYVLFRWETFNLRVGGGWGSLSLPGLNLMAANRMPLVDFDLFWRF